MSDQQHLEFNQPAENETEETRRVYGWWWWSIVLASVFLLGSWLHSGWIAQDKWPLRWLEITSEQQRISDDQIRARLADSLNQGFFSLNLQRIRNQLMELNWIAEVNLQRRWPDTLQITIREHQPVAHWGDGFLLSDRGEVFRAENDLQIQGLPVLKGTEQQRERIVDEWLRWREFSAKRGLRITHVEQEPRGSWVFKFDNSVNLLLGREDFDQRMRRFFNVWTDLRAQLPRPVTLDMRYSNGLALQLPEIELDDKALASHTDTRRSTVASTRTTTATQE